MVNLGVTEATVDPQNSLAIDLVRQCDPKMESCNGIITKIDLYALHSHDGRSILSRLQRTDTGYFTLGFVAVRPEAPCIGLG